MFTLGFIVSALITTALTIKARGGGGSASSIAYSSEQKTFQRTFLAVYYLAMTADWLQGPYVYALYSSYGFSKHDIAVLFVGGFGASMIFGTFVGAAADKLGRKRACLLYCALYIASCVTKHGKDYWVLMLGRLLGGVATSLLFSAFESWMVCEHNARGYDGASLSDTFSLMYFGNSLCAILAGMVAEAAADAKKLTQLAGIWHYGGYCSPFDLSALCLVVCAAMITRRWSENYGSTTLKDAGCANLDAPLKQMRQSPSILMIGLVVSLFEGSMYIFVFNWTPALSASMSTTPPFGFIFATFMVACMGGSSYFSTAVGATPPEKLLRNVFFFSSFALALPLLSNATSTLLVSFLLFEAAVGVYWPSIGTVKSQVVPEASRATIYNLFRVPLNAIVLGVLLNDMSVNTAFMATAVMLLIAGVAQISLIKRMAAGAQHSPIARDERDASLVGDEERSALTPGTADY